MCPLVMPVEEQEEEEKDGEEMEEEDEKMVVKEDVMVFMVRRTDGPIDRRTDGHTLLQKCVDASKKIPSYLFIHVY